MKKKIVDRVTRKLHARYPWKKWLGKRKLILRRGKEYDAPTYSMAQQVRNAAARHGKSVSIAINDSTDSLTITIT